MLAVIEPSDPMLLDSRSLAERKPASARPKPAWLRSSPGNRWLSCAYTGKG